MIAMLNFALLMWPLINEILTVGFGIIKLIHEIRFGFSFLHSKMTRHSLTETTNERPIMAKLPRNGETVDFEQLHGPTGVLLRSSLAGASFEFMSTLSLLSRFLLCNDMLS